MAANEEWISAFDALRKVELILGGRKSAKETLAEYLRDGDLAARAAIVHETEEVTIGKAWQSTPKPDENSKLIDLEPKFWRSSKAWRTDVDSWRWPVDGFSVTTRNRPKKRKMARKLEFKVSEIDALVKSRLTAESDLPKKSRGGAPKKDEAWTAFWHAVIELAIAGRLVQECFESQKSLQDELLLQIQEALGPTSVKSHVAQIYKKFIEEAS